MGRYTVYIFRVKAKESKGKQMKQRKLNFLGRWVFPPLSNIVDYQAVAEK